jgi:hypothetical protein
MLNKQALQGAKMPNHQADIQNANKGTVGTNKTYNQNQGNRGKQINHTSNNANGGKRR